ncbi:hypothetical protein VP01_13608g1, partial [Puccinia sorghi]
ERLLRKNVSSYLVPITNTLKHELIILFPSVFLLHGVVVNCKNLLNPWDQVNDNPSFSCTAAVASKTFESDSKCRIGHFDADASANRDIGSRYGVSGL